MYYRNISASVNKQQALHTRTLFIQNLSLWPLLFNKKLHDANYPSELKKASLLRHLRQTLSDDMTTANETCL
jgi:hypothetical protein